MNLINKCNYFVMKLKIKYLRSMNYYFQVLPKKRVPSNSRMVARKDSFFFLLVKAYYSKSKLGSYLQIETVFN